MSTISHIAYWFHPWHPSFNATERFAELSVQRKLGVIFATAVFGAMTAFVGSIGLFRFFTTYLSPPAKKVDAVARDTLRKSDTELQRSRANSNARLPHQQHKRVSSCSALQKNEAPSPQQSPSSGEERLSPRPKSVPRPTLMTASKPFLTKAQPPPPIVTSPTIENVRNDGQLVRTKSSSYGKLVVPSRLINQSLQSPK